ncbi:hypothetical protein [Rhizobium leguminosarum]|uniref:hypothetical protein n=1 Tax=Rhizobium leguminosarum TaxID=384 RepID=UPI003F98FC75
MTIVFVSRGDDGKINLVSAGPQEFASEAIDDGEQQVIDFLASLTLAPEEGYQISKTTPWLRMTDEEAETMTAAMDAAPARLRAIYNAASFLQSTDPLWPTLRGLIGSALSPERADELLAPET